MERTIDGIDYIAKSEVLNTINSERAVALSYATDLSASPDTRAAYERAWIVLNDLFNYLTGPRER